MTQIWHVQSIACMGNAWRRNWRSKRYLILRFGGKFQGYSKGMLRPEVLLRPQEKSVPQIHKPDS